MKENGIQSSTESSTISYSNVVIPEGDRGITNKVQIHIKLNVNNYLI